MRISLCSAWPQIHKLCLKFQSSTHKKKILCSINLIPELGLRQLKHPLPQVPQAWFHTISQTQPMVTCLPYTWIQISLFIIISSSFFLQHCIKRTKYCENALDRMEECNVIKVGMKIVRMSESESMWTEEKCLAGDRCDIIRRNVAQLLKSFYEGELKLMSEIRIKIRNLFI